MLKIKAAVLLLLALAGCGGTDNAGDKDLRSADEILAALGPHRALSFEQADSLGVRFQHLDSIYMSAAHIDTTKAMFRTDSAQQAMYESYVKLLEDFGKFLSSHNFYWDGVTRFFQRIYFSADGSIDYFIYNFLEKKAEPEGILSEEKKAEFNRLLNLFIQDYKISMTAPAGFAQCSPTTFMPKE